MLTVFDARRQDASVNGKLAFFPSHQVHSQWVKAVSIEEQTLLFNHKTDCRSRRTS
jgi:hypothetical protein